MCTTKSNQFVTRSILINFEGNFSLRVGLDWGVSIFTTEAYPSGGAWPTVSTASFGVRSMHPMICSNKD